MYATPENKLNARNHPNLFYQNNHEPTLSCLNEDMIGNMGDGHKWVCDPNRIEQISREHKRTNQNGCLVYSIGSNGVFDFEEAIQKYMPSCEIHTFDFTNFTNKIPTGLNVSLHVWGIKPSYKEDDQTKFYGKFSDQMWNKPDQMVVFKTLQESMQELGHETRTIE